MSAVHHDHQDHGANAPKASTSSGGNDTMYAFGMAPALAGGLVVGFAALIGGLLGGH